MTSASGKDLIKVPKKHAWELLRVHGIHHIFGKRGSVVRLSVPLHGNRPLKASLLVHLLKMANLTQKDLC